MTEWLTARQVQEILKIDRITVYRMLNDGRIKGIKVGQQWRFAQSEINRLLGGEVEEKQESPVDSMIQDFPVDCAQNVQEIFAGILGVGALMTNLTGEPLTRIHYASPFCKLIQSTPAGKEACQASWRNITKGDNPHQPFQKCHAGLSYVRANIEYENQTTAWLISGQFYLNQPGPQDEKAELERLAREYEIPVDALQEAARKIPVLTPEQRDQVMEWTPKVADTIQSFLCERAELMNRLQQIAALSAIQTKLTD
jgi:excisionase family DNA binding protein